MSPTYDHAALQSLLGSALGAWADEGRRGRVGTAWRFRVAPPGGIARPLVPDIAYLSYEAVSAGAPREDVQVPLAAPTVVVEILSPDDRRADVYDKMTTYLAAGSTLVMIVDPRRETIALHDRTGVRELRAGDVLSHPGLPRFGLDVAALFERARR